MILADEGAAREWFANTLDCGPAVVEQLGRLERRLVEENSRQNLVSSKSLSEVWVRHFADSAQLLTVSRGTPQNWLDLGSGAGFPGLVIALCRPNLQVTLIESRRKRIDWLEAIACELELRNVVVVGRRLEAFQTRQADVISARAFASLPQILALSRRFSTSETQWLLPKGRSGAQELAAMPEEVRRMFHVERSITDPDAAILVGCGILPKAVVK